MNYHGLARFHDAKYDTLSAVTTSGSLSSPLTFAVVAKLRSWRRISDVCQGDADRIRPRSHSLGGIGAADLCAGPALSEAPVPAGSPS